MGNDNWIDEYYALDRSADSTMEIIAERNRILASGGDALKVSAKIRQAQNNFSYDLKSLQRDLNNDKAENKLSPKEYERRKNLLNEANIRRIQITKAFDDGGSSSRGGFGGGISNRAYEVEETEHTQGFSNRELLEQQQQAIRDQDKGLSRIAEIARRQKEIGLTIGDEIDGQNELIEDITHKTDATSSRINRQTKAVKHLSVKEGGVCGYWVIIILLFVAIAAIVLWKITG